MSLHKSLSTLLLAILPLPCAADPVAEAVRTFLQRQSLPPGGEVRIEVQPSTARMPACERPRPFLPGGKQKLRGRVTVGVRCGEGGRRVRYLQARVTVTGNYWVTAGPVEAGTPLTADMLTRARGDLGALPRGAVFEREKVLGRVATRPLGAGTVLQSHLLKAPPLVERRQQVTVEARGHGFRIAREGRALEGGALGESVRVRLPDRSVLSALVSGPGRVRVEL
ncbi:flagellar basal body P-ring formation chaperone FlgA [Microbulbifer sp.]|uniref:flagellar basal body P-ring formation chaperone FlgA n=1 Tax=Microbulbifer sp. TaxID=1908541 RepID=UPI003F3A6DB5